MLRKSRIDLAEFGIKTDIIPWEDEENFKYDALCIERFENQSHRIAMVFNGLGH